MKIEHVAMYVNDLEGTKEFSIKYFGQNQMTDIMKAVLLQLKAIRLK